MARPKKGRYRVLGPYRHHNKWRVICIGPEGSREVATLGSEREAKKEAAAMRRSQLGRLTMELVLDKYEQYLVGKGNKFSSIERTMRRLRLFHDPEMPAADVTIARLKKRYAERREQVAVDSHRNELNESKTFWRWCVREGVLLYSPAEDIEPQGRRKRGKLQLRRSEARALFAEAHRLAETEGDEWALAVLAILCMGLRSGELLNRRARDVDVGPEGVLLWIDEGKTPSARRYHDVPQPVAGLLAARVEGWDPKSWLFPAVMLQNAVLKLLKSLLVMTSRDGGTGRHKGLKIPWYL